MGLTSLREAGAGEPGTEPRTGSPAELPVLTASGIEMFDAGGSLLIALAWLAGLAALAALVWRRPVDGNGGSVRSTRA